MLHSLQHPCIVSLLGISIHPLCFALQLAPLGSLNTVLEEKHKGKGRRCSPPLCEPPSPPGASVEPDFLFALRRLQLHASGSHADLQSGLPDRSRPGLPPQEEHHLL